MAKIKRYFLSASVNCLFDFYGRDLPGIAAHKSPYCMVVSVAGQMAAMKMKGLCKDNISFYHISPHVKSDRLLTALIAQIFSHFFPNICLHLWVATCTNPHRELQNTCQTHTFTISCCSFTLKKKKHNVIIQRVGGEMSVFSFTVPTWFMNEQPPGSGDQPTSSATNQPLAIFQSKCVLSARFPLLWAESSCCSVVCLKIWSKIDLELHTPGGLLTVMLAWFLSFFHL